MTNFDCYGVAKELAVYLDHEGYAAEAGKLRDAGKQVELVDFNGLDRQLADSSVHTTMLDRSDAILRKTLGL